MPASRYILLMAKILHQLIGSLSHYLQDFIHVRWLFGISSINSITLQVGLHPLKDVISSLKKIVVEFTCNLGVGLGWYKVGPYDRYGVVTPISRVSHNPRQTHVFSAIYGGCKLFHSIYNWLLWPTLYMHPFFWGDWAWIVSSKQLFATGVDDTSLGHFRSVDQKKTRGGLATKERKKAGKDGSLSFSCCF